MAIPTTAGTGAETNGFGVIEDHVARRKRYMGDASTAPRHAILDPALTVTAPAHVTAACGIDVLAHAIESLQARAGNAYSAALALEAARLVARHLPRAVAEDGDTQARSAMLLAAHLAGLAFSTTGLGPPTPSATRSRRATGRRTGSRSRRSSLRLRRQPRGAETARLADALGGAVPDAIAELQDGIGLRPRSRARRRSRGPARHRGGRAGRRGHPQRPANPLARDELVEVLRP